MEPAAEQLEVVAEHQQRPERDEHQQPGPDAGHARDPQRHGAHQTADRRRPQRGVRDLRPQGPAVELVEGVGPDGPPPEFGCPEVSAVIRVPDDEAFTAATRLAREEGLLVGASAGAAFAGALRHAQAVQPGTRMVVILPDTGRNYVGSLAG